MSEMEDQLGAILGNPKMMEQIMSLAQSMGQPDTPPPPTGKQDAPPPPPGKPDTPPPQPGKPDSPPPPPRKQDSPPPVGDMDLAIVKAFTGFARNSGIDKNQKALLEALCPFIGKEKRLKLEKAMRAAKMAQQASCLFEAGGGKRLL